MKPIVRAVIISCFVTLVILAVVIGFSFPEWYGIGPSRTNFAPNKTPNWLTNYDNPAYRELLDPYWGPQDLYPSSFTLVANNYNNVEELIGHRNMENVTWNNITAKQVFHRVSNGGVPNVTGTSDRVFSLSHRESGNQDSYLSHTIPPLTNFEDFTISYDTNNSRNLTVSAWIYVNDFADNSNTWHNVFSVNNVSDEATWPVGGFGFFIRQTGNPNTFTASFGFLPERLAPGSPQDNWDEPFRCWAADASIQACPHERVREATAACSSWA